MTKFAVTATTKITKITVKTIPIVLLFSKSPRRTKSEKEVLFFIDISYNSSRGKEATNTRGKKDRKTLLVSEKFTMAMTPQRLLVQVKFSKL